MTTITATPTELRNRVKKYIAESGLANQVNGETEGALSTFDPYTGEELAQIPISTVDGVRGVVEKANASFRDPTGWRSLAVADRAEFLTKLSDRIDAEFDDLARLESIDAGKLYSSTRGWDVGNARDVLRFYASEGPTYLARTTRHERAVSERVPLGVVAALAPWNAPLAVGVWKLAPALLAGCTIVIKAPERAPLTTLALRRLAAEVGIPEDVVSVVAGPGDPVGATLIADPRVSGISFTGGTSIASSIVSASASHLPRLVLELGGKNANVVFSDADIEAAAQGTVVAMFDVAGQNCCAGSRTLVEASIFDDFAGRVAEIASSMKVGDQFDESTQMAPLVDQRHAADVLAYIEAARSAGSEVLCGGEVDGPAGTCVRPTIVRPDSFESPIWRDEVFGPVGCIAPFKDFDEAVSLANDTEFGLSASVWSGSDSTVREFSNAIDVGVCWTNTFGLFDIGVPWGGTKQSGYGRELSIEALDDFTSPKTIY